jgi:hypothetical protein
VSTNVAAVTSMAQNLRAEATAAFPLIGSMAAAPASRTKA